MQHEDAATAKKIAADFDIRHACATLDEVLAIRDLDAVRHAGAETVISAEGEVGLALTEAILHRLGATPDQIDHERERVRTEFSK